MPGNRVYLLGDNGFMSLYLTLLFCMGFLEIINRRIHSTLTQRIDVINNSNNITNSFINTSIYFHIYFRIQ